MPKSTSPTARERERLDLPVASAHDRDDRETSPRSSSDPVLTAFAQLGAHRLRAKRGLITLSARDTEYILAEAGVGLGLQQDDDKNDPLWHGAVALKENCGLGMELVKIFCGDDEATPKYAFSLTLARTTGSPKNVLSRGSLIGMVIGTYIVVDDKPHEGLSEGEIEFLIDMGVTVMDHLEAQRLNQMQYRSERMTPQLRRQHFLSPMFHETVLSLLLTHLKEQTHLPPKISKELQEALLTKDLKAVFGRASNLIREAGGVDGTIFYDASISSFGAASQKDSMEQKAPGNFDVNEAKIRQYIDGRIQRNAQRKRISREAEAAALRKALPGARSRILVSIVGPEQERCISHELRSPLHGVLASVEFLQETEMTEVQTDMNPKAQSSDITENPVTIIMDVQWRPNWTFEVDAGAWRRILLNLFGNSMKQERSIYDGAESQRLRQGISKEFLKHHLYKPFAQEDSLAAGAGLGLSIVRHIIQDLEGEINFKSEQGVGTEATVKLPMVASLPSKQDMPDFVAQEWFGMEPGMTFTIDKTQFDVEVIMESGVSSLDDKLKSYESRPDNFGPSIVIILCEAYPQGLKAVSHGLLKVFYVPQPSNIKRNGNTSAPEAAPAPVQPPYVNLIPDALPTHQDWYNSSPAAYTSPTSDIPMPNAPAPVVTPLGFDRRTSIDTSVVNHKGGLRVLLVEDNEINLKLLVAYMRKLKLNHATAINGLEALNRYKEAQGGFDVIFMDISMPIMSGIESTRHIRRFEREQGLNPVALVALTGAANPTTRQEAFSSGVDLFLTKPVPMRSLKIMLDDLRNDGRRIGA
ncbi:hypothetical protein B0O99DRAFT_724009 [Bisporella sp. PMI_857]|nr:hypothetical protein B0O99DRAFT_729472 [Bisporella sp. PMI_857]KAH8600439.1 hypothetical protein B0O99DRAFT_724009 [Bisporella sp. PMI_857]